MLSRGAFVVGGVTTAAAAGGNTRGCHDSSFWQRAAPAALEHLAEHLAEHL